ncbi:MAG: glycosyltransferase [Alphaproteobacteria bacterium]
MKSWRLLLVTSLVLLVNFVFWAVWNRPVNEQGWKGTIKAVAFTPYQAEQSPLEGKHPSLEQMDNDLKEVARFSNHVRTYTTADGENHIPELARKHGISVTAGAWIEGNTTRDREQIEELVKIVQNNQNVTSVVVGNEVVLRGELSADQMADYLKEVRRRVHVPVSTAEIWQNWLKYPQLVEASDYLAAHILPYWEGVPADKAVDYVMDAYNQLKAAYPNKRIVISEVGWPSEGPWVKGAEPSIVNQAAFLRKFLNMANENKLDYSVMESIDQPWKRAIEGPAGTSWGIIDKHREFKFPFVGKIQETPHWPRLAILASVLAMPFILLFLRRFSHGLRPVGILFYVGLIQAIASLLVGAVYQAFSMPILPSMGFAWSLLVLTQLVLIAVILTDGFELTETLWQKQLGRLYSPQRGVRPTLYQPKVSIHVPAYNEPPQMVIDTLNALAALDYSNFEVLLIDNNTKDEAVWKPVQEHCKLLGEKFRFYHLDNWPGYKAGALNFALRETATDAEIVAVIDSDYQVDSDWLAAMVPAFSDDKVGLVQSPQDYREWQNDAFQAACHWEYAGFFRIGMIQRNERNAIIQHGTMTMIRKKALEGAAGWAEWCITEDAELGLKLFEAGWLAVYSPESFGKGLVPDSFSAYKTQRFRWAYGAVQIVKHHIGDLFKKDGKLTPGQRYHFLAGWMPWFADCAHLFFAGAAVFWSVGVLFIPKIFGFPPTAFMIPTIAAFVFKIIASLWLYHRQVRCAMKDRLLAGLAGMGLTYTVGRAVWQGIWTSGRPFVRTPKCEDKPALMQGIMMARDEICWALLLWALALAVVINCTIANHEALLWAVMLMVQSLPFTASMIVSFLNIWPQLKARLSKKPAELSTSAASS